MQEGEVLTADTVTCILEAMKMEINVHTEPRFAGVTVIKVLVKAWRHYREWEPGCSGQETHGIVSWLGGFCARRCLYLGCAYRISYTTPRSNWKCLAIPECNMLLR